MSNEDGDYGQAMEELPEEHRGYAEAVQAPPDPGPADGSSEDEWGRLAADEAEPRQEEGGEQGTTEDAPHEPPAPAIDPTPAMLRLQSAMLPFFEAQAHLAVVLQALHTFAGVALSAPIQERTDALTDAMQGVLDVAQRELVAYAERDQAPR